MYVAKTKALTSFAVTAKLVCVFVFAYAKRWFLRYLPLRYDKTPMQYTGIFHDRNHRGINSPFQH